jgi:hypothetical protein
MRDEFEVAAGSVIGREHLRLGRNNQDAFSYKCSDHATIAVVCDGCSGGAHSEVGAKLGARLVAQEINRMLIQGGECGLSGQEFWETVHRGVLQQLSHLGTLLPGDAVGQSSDRISTIHDFLLFTIVGVVIARTITCAFTIGDGIIVLNGENIPVPTFANNAPPYLGYGLIPEMAGIDPEKLQFCLYAQVPTESVQSILIGSDGVGDLLAASDKQLPGKGETVGKIDQFWECDRYFQNPDLIRRRLFLINREVIKPDWQNQQLLREAGLLPDDTTLVVVRRIQNT